MLEYLNIGNRVIERSVQNATRRPDSLEFKEGQLLDDTLPFFDASPSQCDSEKADPPVSRPPFSRLENLFQMMEAIDACILKKSEVEVILKSLDSYCDSDKIKFFSKSLTGITRSFTISKFEDDKNGTVFEIFLKPRIKNSSPCAKKGSYKIVKRGGIQIILSSDKQQIISVSPQVTVSKDCDGRKNDKLDENGLLREGFQLMAFHDAQKNQSRKIYRLSDFGEPLDTPDGRAIFQRLDLREKKRVCLNFIQQAKDLDAFDIKLANALIASNGKITIIDHHTKVFTFTPSTSIHEVSDGIYESESEKTCQEARILSLTIALLSMIEEISWSHYGRQFSYNGFKITPRHLQEAIHRKSAVQSNRPLLKALVKAYGCHLTYEELITSVEASFEEQGVPLSEKV